jgi:F0F1-type ATP synthase assembly protein I
LFIVSHAPRRGRRAALKGSELDDSQRRELSNDIFHRSSGSFELVLSPLLLGAIGFWVDHRVGVVPLFTILFALAGAIGAVLNVYYGYRHAMTAVEASRAEAKSELASSRTFPS